MKSLVVVALLLDTEITQLISDWILVNINGCDIMKFVSFEKVFSMPSRFLI